MPDSLILKTNKQTNEHFYKKCDCLKSLCLEHPNLLWHASILQHFYSGYFYDTWEFSIWKTHNAFSFMVYLWITGCYYSCLKGMCMASGSGEQKMR